MTGKVVSIFTIGLLFGRLTLAHATLWPDSTGVENKNGKTYVVHRVDAGQTLYAVMRKYKTTLQAIKDANPGMKDNLVTGQTVKVPYTMGKSPAVAVAKPKTVDNDLEIGKAIVIKPIEAKVEPKAEEKIVIAAEQPKAEASEKIKIEGKPLEPEKPLIKPAPMVSKNGLHQVEAGQSLYGVAVKYGVMMADVRRWNGLSTDQLRAGQEIIVSEQGYLDYIRKPRPDSAKVSEVKKNAPEKATLPPPRHAEDATNANLPETRVANSGSRMIEMGTAEVIDVLDNGNKYLALHRTAPVGSLVQVKNINNGQSVWVKVIGKLPEISSNNRIIIKLSARAYEKLSPGGKRFSAEINYLAE